MDTMLFLTVLALVLTALLAGSMAFFSFVMAPLIFIKLEMATAGRFVRAVFPWYYLLVMVLSLAGGLSLLGSLTLNGGMLLLVAAAAIYCRQFLMPQINSYRDQSLFAAGDSQAEKIFNRLHKRSELINSLQLLAVFAVLLHLAFLIELP